MADPRWRSVPEVVVRRPAHGVIDLVLIDPAEAEIVSAEIHSDLHRVEEHLRRAQAKTDALPSSDVWAIVAGETEPRVSRLLILRSTSRTR